MKNLLLALLVLLILVIESVVSATNFPEIDINNYQPAYSTGIYDPTVGDTCSSTVTNKWFTSVNQTCLTLPILDITPTGVDCSGSSGVNPNDSSQYIIRDTGGLAQLNNGTYNQFFLCPGDYSGASDITLTANGTVGTRRWLIQCDGASDVCLTSSTSHPYKDKDIGYEQAQVPAIAIEGDYWVLTGLKCISEKIGDGGPGWCFNVQVTSGDASYNILDRLWVDGSQIDGPDDEEAQTRLVRFFHNSDYSKIQFSVIGPCYPDVNSDHYGIYRRHGSPKRHIVSNEIFDCSDAIQAGTAADSYGGEIVENNDIYYSTYLRMDCGSGGGIQQGETLDQARNVNGDCVCGEEPIDIKAGGVSGDWDYWVNNRIWGGRPYAWAYKPSSTAMTKECGATGAGRGATAINFNDNSAYMYFLGNIISDSQTGIFYGGGGDDGPNRNVTYLEQNLFHGIEVFEDDDGTNTFRHGCIGIGTAEKDSYMFNTCIMETAGTQLFTVGGTNEELEIACNIFIGGGPSEYTYTPTPPYIANNVYVDGADVSDDSNPNPSSGTHTTSAIGLGQYKYYRKLLTGPELITVNGVVPGSNNPDSWKTHCSGYTRRSGYGAN